MTPSPAVVRQPGPGETSPTHHLDAGEGQGQEGAAGGSHGGPDDGGRRTRPRLEEEEEEDKDDDDQQQQPRPIDDAAHHLLGEGFGALPLEIARDQVLPYLDGQALAQWGGASHTTRAQVNRDEGALWRNLVEKEYGWLFGKRLPRYLTPAEFYGHVRRATAPLVGADPQGANIWDPLHQWRPGRLVCVGT